jgi:ADP-heptose:LPS heptosyltransferase
MKMVSVPKKIVFYRIGAIGDIIHSLPLLELTRELNPQARIEYIVGSKQIADLLNNYAPYIDKVHSIEHGGVFDKPSKLFATKSEKELIEELGKSPVDEFIYLHGNKLKANLLNKRFVKAKNLYVYKRDESLSAHANYVITRYPDLYEDLKEDSFRVLKTNTLRAVSSSPIASCNDLSKSVSIVLGVGKLRPTRAYPLILWVKLIEKLLTETDYQINILGGPDELELSEEFEALIKQRKEALHYAWLKRIPDFSKVNNLIGQTSLLELAKVLKNTDKLFSADTGILHIAAALDTSIVSVYSITSEKRFGPFAKNAEILRSKSCSCAQSYTNLPKHCQNIASGYAKCMFDINLLTKC